MALDPKAVHKPFRKLGKLLKNFPDPPSEEDVHDVRTQTRRLEAICDAFHLENKKVGSRLLRSLKPIRKAAGGVRDMDVLIDLTASLDPENHASCRLKLVEHLANRRTKAAKKLMKTVNDAESDLKPLIKHCRQLAESGLDAVGSTDPKEEKERAKARRKSVESMASSLEIEQELRDWPKLSSDNIHPFRLKVKELRYVLQLGRHDDSRLIDRLGEVKDQIGRWHDWDQLAGIAAKVLDHGASCPVNARIRETTKQELQKALEISNQMRAEYLAADSSRRPKKKAAVKEIHPAMVQATSRLAS
jgi:CHAD domain-containing protein